MAALDQRAFADFKPGDEIRLQLPEGKVADIVFDHAGKAGIAFEPNTRGRFEYPVETGVFFYDQLVGVSPHPDPKSLDAEIYAHFVDKAATSKQGDLIHFKIKGVEGLLTMAYYDVGPRGCLVEPVVGRTVGHSAGIVFWENVESVHTHAEYLDSVRAQFYPKVEQIETLGLKEEVDRINITLNNGDVITALYCHHGYNGVAFEPENHAKFPIGFKSWSEIASVSEAPVVAF